MNAIHSFTISNRRPTPCAAPFFFGLVTAKLYETWDFYTEYLGFRTFEEADDRILLIHPSGARLGIMRQETDDRYPERVSATDGRGIWLTVEVSDLDATFARLRDAGGAEFESFNSEGQQGIASFAIRDPNGVLIFVTRTATAAFGAEEMLEPFT